MAIDYWVQFPCEVRRQAGDEKLAEMIKAKDRATISLAFLRETPGPHHNLPESEWSVTYVQLFPEGPREMKLRVADLFAKAEPLKKLAEHCHGCPFAQLRGGVDFGCGGAIHYPVFPQAEEWLVSRLPDDPKSMAGQILFRAVSDLKFDGADINASRSRDELYVAKKPAVRKWGGFLGKKITSSQILQMMFDVGNYDATHAKLLALFLGYVDEQFLLTTRSDNIPSPTDHPNTAEFKKFLLAVACAGYHGCPVLVSA